MGQFEDYMSDKIATMKKKMEDTIMESNNPSETIMYFPNRVEIGLSASDEEITEKIRESFRKYIKGVRQEDLYLAKLAYIDDCRRIIRQDEMDDSKIKIAVNDLITKEFDRKVKDTGHIPESSEFFTMNFMRTCYKGGLESEINDLHRTYSKNGPENRRIMEIFAKVIEVVMRYE